MGHMAKVPAPPLPLPSLTPEAGTQREPAYVLSTGALVVLESDTPYCYIGHNQPAGLQRTTAFSAIPTLGGAGPGELRDWGIGFDNVGKSSLPREAPPTQCWAIAHTLWCRLRIDCMGKGTVA